MQRLSTDLEEAKAAGESSGKRAEASAHEVGLKEGEVQRVREALAATEARLAASARYLARSVSFVLPTVQFACLSFRFGAAATLTHRQSTIERLP